MELTERKRRTDAEIPAEITELHVSFVKRKKYVKPSGNEDFYYLVHFHINTGKYLTKAISNYRIKRCRILFMLTIIFLRYY